MRIKMMAAITAMAVCVGAGVSLMAAPGTWTGKISDSMCGASHDMGGKNQTDKECTASCVKDGSKYVLVFGDKVLKIANQDFKDLAKFAGDAVKITGDADKDNVITITKIEAAPVKGK
jgi:hypothetical protein